MTIEELLRSLEDCGLVINDWDSVMDELSLLGYAPFDMVLTAEELEEVYEV